MCLHGNGSRWCWGPSCVGLVRVSGHQILSGAVHAFLIFYRNCHRSNNYTAAIFLEFGYHFIFTEIGQIDDRLFRTFFLFPRSRKRCPYLRAEDSNELSSAFVQLHASNILERLREEDSASSACPRVRQAPLSARSGPAVWASAAGRRLPGWAGLQEPWRMFPEVQALAAPPSSLLPRRPRHEPKGLAPGGCGPQRVGWRSHLSCASGRAPGSGVASLGVPSHRPSGGEGGRVPTGAGNASRLPPPEASQPSACASRASDDNATLLEGGNAAGRRKRGATKGIAMAPDTPAPRTAALTACGWAPGATGAHEQPLCGPRRSGRKYSSAAEGRLRARRTDAERYTNGSRGKSQRGEMG